MVVDRLVPRQAGQQRRAPKDMAFLGELFPPLAREPLLQEQKAVPPTDTTPLSPTHHPPA